MPGLTITQIISGAEGTYEGNLKAYFKIIFENASNLANPYHNLRHMLYVTEQCYCGASRHHIKPRDFRNLLVSALFHDFNHSGSINGHDDLEIEMAIRALRKYILPEDVLFIRYIEDDIRATQFPHIVNESVMSLNAKILRDSDISQGLDDEYLQQIVFGLGKEMRITPREMLQMQEKFLSRIEFASAWGKVKFEPRRLQRINEVKTLLEMLEEGE